MGPALVKNSVDDGSDVEVARRIAGGDCDAFRRVMRQYNQRMYRTARSILKDDAEAEDAVQEAYLSAYQSIGGFRGGSQLATWLVRIVVNEALGRVRKRKRRAELIDLYDTTEPGDDRAEASMSDATPDGPERAAQRAQIRRLLEAQIDRLPDAFRTVFVLRAIEEMPVDEAAACLGIPEATVRTRYFRARGLLREALAREIDFGFEDAFAFAGARCDRIVEGVLDRLKDRRPSGA